MGYAVSQNKGAIRQKVRDLSISRTRSRRLVQAGDSLAALESWQRARALEGWFSFLAEEAGEPEGLLCYFDRPRAARVERCRSVFLLLFLK
jgi:hypothetical protein|uniref:Uncharacterized protein n=1 Tax=Desulfobacca acetoxidans TaxID=60893 RepID=A0A7V6A323_9BACT